MSHENYHLLLNRFHRAQSKHDVWHGLWQDCYDYALPQRGQLSGYHAPANRRSERLYDGTALDSVDQLASLLLGHLTPPLTPWFGFKPGTDLTDAEAKAITPALERASKLIQAHFDQSNFIVEIHQCFLDLVVAGTASLAFEETLPGELSAFQFTAVPLHEIILEEGTRGKLDIIFRKISLTRSGNQIRPIDIDLDRAPFAIAFIVQRLIFDRIQRAEIGRDKGIKRSHVFETFDRIQGAAGAIRDQLQA